MLESTSASLRKRARRLTRLLLASAAIVVAQPLAAAHGQEADELIDGEFVADGAQPRSSILGDGGFIYQSDADIDDGGSLQAYRYDLGVAGRIELLDRLRWGNTLFVGVNDYDFAGGGFSAGDPWNTILNLRLGTRLTYGITEQWGVSAGGVFIFSPETGADWGDSFTGGGLVAAEYRHSETLFASVGVAVMSQIEDDVAVTPAVAINWLPDEHWAVRVGAVPASGGAAAAAEAAYRFAAPLELGFGVLYQQRRFRLDDSGPAPDGVGEDDSLPVRLRLAWNINENVSLNLLGGVVLGGELRLENENGRHLRAEGYDPAAYVGLRLLGVF